MTYVAPGVPDRLCPPSERFRRLGMEMVAREQVRLEDRQRFRPLTRQEQHDLAECRRIVSELEGLNALELHQS